MFITEDKTREFERSTVKHGDLILTCWGTIDQVGLIDERSHYEEYLISNKPIKMTPDPAIADSRFLYYQLSSPKLRSWIIDNGIGSSVPGFNLVMLKSMELNIPPLPNAAPEWQARSCCYGNRLDGGLPTPGECWTKPLRGRLGRTSCSGKKNRIEPASVVVQAVLQ